MEHQNNMGGFTLCKDALRKRFHYSWLRSWYSDLYRACRWQQQTDVPAYVLDASTLSADDFGGYKTMITADMTLGTNGFFTLYSKGSKNSLADLSANPLTAENGTYTQAINWGGGLKNSGQAGIGFTLDKPAKLTAYVAVKVKNDTK